MQSLLEPLVDKATSILTGSSPIPYLEVVIAFQIVVFLWSAYLDLRQYKEISRPHPPKEVKKIYEKDEQLYAKTRLYSIDKWNFSMVHGVYSAIVQFLTLKYGLLPVLWGRSGQILSALGLLDRGYSAHRLEILQSVTFMLVYFLLITVTEIPWNLYSQFVVEERHGFNKMTLGLFVTDTLKSVALAFVLGPPIIAGVTYILLLASPYIALYLWAFFAAFTLFLITIYPVFIAPLFNKFSPLEDGELKAAIEALASSLKFPLTRLFVIDGSKRSAHSNAYMYGFFKNKRIVLYDTLLSHCNVQQVVAVLAHELGHWSHSHVLKAFAVQQFVTLAEFSLYTVVRGDPNVMTSFGFVDTAPVLVNFLLFTMILGPVSEVLGFLFNVMSRANERQADSFAVKLGHAKHLKAALISLNKENKSNPNTDWLFSAYHHSHPPLVERLKYIDSLERKSK